MKNNSKFILISVGLLLAMVFSMAGCSMLSPTAPVDSNAKDTIVVTIPKGSGTGAIAEILKDQKLIRSVGAFKALAKQLSDDGKLKAGDYELSQAMSSDEILEKMAKGDVFKIKVVIPEGYELKQIEDKLAEQKLIDRERFEDLVANGNFDYRFLDGIPNGPKRLEGFLFPATYRIPRGATERDILEMMLQAFDKNFKPEYYQLAETNRMSVLKVVTLASIVEREAKLDKERPVIASVFLNRLRINKQLESCATIQYALGERKPRLYYKDLEIVSPYNTYKHRGLPPGPIASPGIKSIMAVLEPAHTNFLFFRTSGKNDGSHAFSKTFEQHELSGEGVAAP